MHKIKLYKHGWGIITFIMLKWNNCAQIGTIVNGGLVSYCQSCLCLDSFSCVK